MTRARGQQAQEKEYTWDDLLDAVGQDFSEGVVTEGDETVDRSSIRRYCEPLEIDCPLYYDDEVAKQHGYKGVIAPWSSYGSVSGNALWKPGYGEIWDSTDPDHTISGPGARSRQREGPQPPPIPQPKTNAGFATDIEIEYFRPVYVGDRLSRRGRKLVSVIVRETRVGYGSFTVYESEVVNQRGELVAKMRNGGYQYIVGAKGPTKERSIYG